MATTQTLDILVAEMLGDIGKLNDQVAYLKLELPTILNQMQAVIAAQAAKAEVLQEPTQRALRTFVSQELRGVKVAVKEAKTEVLNEFEMEVVDAVRKNLNWMHAQNQQTFDIAAKQCVKSFDVASRTFDTAMTESAKAAEVKTTQTLEGLCQVLQARIDDLHTERWTGQYLRMLAACMSTGLVVGALVVFSLK